MIQFSQPQKYTAKVLDKVSLTEKVYQVKYGLIEPDSIDFVAGQTIMLNISEGVNRSMSIASPPQEKNVITSIQDVSPGGPASQWMTNLNVGDEVRFMAPLGRFVIDRDSPRKRVLVATGTGVAPFRSMLLDSSDGLTGQKQISFYWGLRHEEDVYLRGFLEKLDADYDNLVFYLVLSKPTENWTCLKGHVNEHVIANEKDLANCDFYLCGNKNMIMEMQKLLAEKGIPRQQMKFDPYY